MNETYKQKKIFNTESQEAFMDAKIVGGNPNGIMNFNRCPHSFAYPLYKKMIARTWFPDDVNISKDKVNYSTLNPEEKRMYDLVLAQLIANDSIQANQLADKINGYITSPIVNACLIRQSSEECLVPETEVLKDNGVWTPLKDIKVGDRILASNLDGLSYFTTVTHMTIKDIDDYIYNFHSEHMSQKVTAGHRMPVYENSSPLSIMTAEELYNERLNNDLSSRNFLSNTFNYLIYRPRENYDEKEYENLPPRWLTLPNMVKFMVTLQVDGTVPVTNIVIEGKTITKIFSDMIDIRSFTLQSAREFISEILNCDGRDYGNDVVGYETTIKDNAEFVSAVATLAGYRVNVSVEKDERSENSSDLYKVSICKTSIELRRGTVTIDKEKYTGKVYCPTVNGSLFLVRHNGKVSLTGNCIHAQSYAVMAEEICQDTDRIYDMHNHDEELMLKNKAVEDMYAHLYNGDDPKVEDLLMAMVANQILEELVFPGGFVALFSLATKLPGSAEMAQEIMKDETLSHVELFKNIFRATINENCNGVVPEKVVELSLKLIHKVADAERRWTKYVTKGILGFSDESVDTFIDYKVNNICKNLMLPIQFVDNDKKPNPLKKLLLSYLADGNNDTRQNFFEQRNLNYNKGNLEDDGW